MITYHKVKGTDRMRKVKETHSTVMVTLRTSRSADFANSSLVCIAVGDEEVGRVRK